MDCIIVEQIKACCQQFSLDFFDLRLVAGLQLQLEVAASDGHVYIAAIVLHADNISAAAANDFANLAQLARTVIQRNNKVSLATGGDLTTGDNTGKDVNIDVTAGY